MSNLILNKAVIATAASCVAFVVGCFSAYTFVEGRAKQRATVENLIGDNTSSIERIESRHKDWREEVNKDVWVLQGDIDLLRVELTNLRVEVARIHGNN